MKKIMRYILTGVNIAFILMIVTLTSGCQPTPERTAVVHGGDLEVEIEAFGRI
jgi:hypothetical protein